MKNLKKLFLMVAIVITLSSCTSIALYGVESMLIDRPERTYEVGDDFYFTRSYKMGLLRTRTVLFETFSTIEISLVKNNDTLITSAYGLSDGEKTLFDFLRVQQPDSLWYVTTWQVEYDTQYKNCIGQVKQVKERFRFGFLLSTKDEETSVYLVPVVERSKDGGISWSSSEEYDSYEVGYRVDFIFKALRNAEMNPIY